MMEVFADVSYRGRGLDAQARGAGLVKTTEGGSWS